MFENGELDLMKIDSATYEASLDPSHPFNPLLKVTPYGGLWFIKNRIDMAPLDDLLVRKALAHGVDMWEIVRAVWGVTEDIATGLISPLNSVPQPRCQRALLRPRSGPPGAGHVFVQQRRGPAAAADRPGQAADDQPHISHINPAGLAVISNRTT